MQWSVRVGVITLLVVWGGLPVYSREDPDVFDHPEDDQIRVVVRFKDSQQKRDFLWQQNQVMSKRSSSSTTPKESYSYRHGNAVAMSVTQAELESLQTDPTVAAVSRDTLTYLHATSEVTPQGIPMIQADSNTIPLPETLIGACKLDDSFKVCIVDSGLYVAHEDIPYRQKGPYVLGDIFGLDGTLHTWYNPSAASSHGTHVTGTVLAEGNNDIGVVGVIPDPRGICLLVARVFDDTGSQYTSKIVEAVEWCGDYGANIINLSLGSTQESPDDDYGAVFDGLWDDGILLVASSGNDYTSGKAYPASFQSVLSVAAVDNKMVKADFSQYNDQVDIAAPGVDIPSTVVSNRILLHVNQKDPEDLEATLMEYSPGVDNIDPAQQLSYVDCEQGFEICKNAQKAICLIERGTNYFTEKALNCQEGGGVAAFVYNNIPGSFGGSLGDEDSGVEIPTYAMPRAHGLLLLDQINRRPTVTIAETASAYASMDGTSMAAPHVTGVAAKIWAARPACTNAQVRQALEETAMDLGPEGRDDEYGHGLVQAESAYLYLLNQFPEPCGQGEPSDSPTLAPTVQTSSPTKSPTQSPTEKTPAPTSNPTAAPTEETPSPTRAPSVPPTPSPTSTPSVPPTLEPTFEPSETPSRAPTAVSSSSPTRAPTSQPSLAPTREDTLAPTSAPTVEPSAGPTLKPTPSAVTQTGTTSSLSPRGSNDTVPPTLSPTTNDTDSGDPDPADTRPYWHAFLLALSSCLYWLWDL